MVGKGVASVVGVVGMATLAVAQVSTRAVLVEGDSAPWFEGAAFAAFGNPVAQADSEGIEFRAVLAGGQVNEDSDVAIYRREYTGALYPIVREGDQAPGCPAGVVFEDLRSPHPFRNSNTHFMALLRGPGVDVANDAAIFRRVEDSSFQLVMRQGNQATGLPSGVVWDGTSEEPLARFAAVGFLGTSFVSGLAGPGVDGFNDMVLFSPWHRLREGTLVDGQTITAISVGPAPSLHWTRAPAALLTLQDSDSGQVRHAIASRIGLFALEGGAADFLEDAIYLELTPPHVSGDVDLLYLCRVEGPGVSEADDTMVVLAHSGGRPTQVVLREGQLVAGALDAEVAGFNEQLQPVTTRTEGDFTLISARLRGSGITGSNDECVLIGTSEGFEVIAREGDAISSGPGLTMVSFENYYLNEGRVVIDARLSDGNRALLSWNSDRGLRLVVREGGLVHVSHGYFEQVMELSVWDVTGPSGGDDGRRSPLSIEGDLYFRAIVGAKAPFEAIFKAEVAGCWADYDGDSLVTSADITSYLAAWFADVANGTGFTSVVYPPTADSADLAAFLGRWFDGLYFSGCP